MENKDNTSRQQLDTNERSLRQSIENMLEGYALHEAILDDSGRMADFRYLEFNPAAQKIIGIAREDIVGKTAREFFPHITKRGLMDRYADVMATGKPDYIEDFYYSGDNLDKAFDISCYKVGDSRFVCLFRDITERKKAEEEINKQQFYLSKAQELGTIGTWELDVTQNKLYWTDENCRIFGVPEGTTVNYEIFIDIVHPDDRNYVDREWKRALQGNPYDIEHRILVNGEIKWVREKADVLFDKEGLAIKAIGITQDITDHKRREETLYFTKFALDNISESLFWSKKDGHFVYVNRSAYEELGYSCEELMKMKVSDFDPNFPVDVWGDHWEDLKKRGSIYLETIHQKKDGTLFPVEVMANYIEYDGQEFNCSIVRDITERKQHEEELLKYQDNLEELVEERTKEYQRIINLMSGRENRMAELKKVIKKLKKQIKNAGTSPVANDPLKREE